MDYQTILENVTSWLFQDVYHLMTPIVAIAAFVIYRTIRISFNRSKVWNRHHVL